MEFMSRRSILEMHVDPSDSTSSSSNTHIGELEMHVALKNSMFDAASWGLG